MPNPSPQQVDVSEFQSVSDGGDASQEGILHGLCMNQPNGGPLIPDDPSTEAPHTRAMADLSKRWEPGSTLHVFFLNGTDAWGEEIRQAVRRIAPIWSQYAHINFDFDQPTAHISVNLQNPALRGAPYSSWLGTDCVTLGISRRLPSMHLVFPRDLIRAATKEQEFNRVILHEFGHALGLIHEHQRPDRPIRWNFQALRDRFGGPPNDWPDHVIRQQIVDFHQGGEVLGGSFDMNSIMMYEYPQGLAFYEDGTPFQTPSNFVLTPLDKVVANMVYPKAAPQVNETQLLPGDPPVSGSIQVPRQVIPYSFTPMTGEIHNIEVRGGAPMLVALLSQRGNPMGRMLASEGTNVRLAISPQSVGRPYFVEVRHAQPITGTGDFQISVGV